MIEIKLLCNKAMFIQLSTICGRRIRRELPININTSTHFREWLCKQILDVDIDKTEKDEVGNLASNAVKKMQNDIAIRAHGRSINDRIVQEWQDRESMIEVEWQPRGRGGFIMEVIQAVIAIFRFMLFIPKLLIWIGQLIIWMIKALIYLVNTVFIILSKDGIIGLIKFIVNEIVLLPFKIAAHVAKTVVNTLGKQTIYGIWGADNARNSNLGREDTNNPPSDTVISDIECDGQQRCYIRPDGSVPFGVVVVTVLCPPVGVFMEYGVQGWLKILVCLVATLLFYFPGLIYALILLYC